MFRKFWRSLPRCWSYSDVTERYNSLHFHEYYCRNIYYIVLFRRKYEVIKGRWRKTNIGKTGL